MQGSTECCAGTLPKTFPHVPFPRLLLAGAHAQSAEECLEGAIEIFKTRERKWGWLCYRMQSWLRHVYQHRLRGRMYNSILASVLCLWFWTTTLVLKPLIHMLVFIKVLKRISSCRATMEESTCNIFI
mgnify:CR=1 FL=1